MAVASPGVAGVPTVVAPSGFLVGTARGRVSVGSLVGDEVAVAAVFSGRIARTTFGRTVVGGSVGGEATALAAS